MIFSHLFNGFGFVSIQFLDIELVCGLSRWMAKFGGVELGARLRSHFFSKI